jgi:hypothetical protein
MQDHSPQLLTALGVVGTITTAILSARAGYRAAVILAEEERERPDEPMEAREIFEATWTQFVPAVATGSVTIASIFGAQIIGGRRTAAIAAAYALSEKAIGEYKDKVIEKFGESKERAVRDEIAQDHVRLAPVGKNEIVVTGGGDVLCYEMYTGRYFYSSAEHIRRVENEINHQVINSYYASLSDLYDKLGLHRTQFSEEVGWNVDHLLEIQFSTTLSDDDRPCLAINFKTSPVRYYHRVN